MPPSGKWIEGISPDGSVEDAARLSLDARLSAVHHWLPLAAYLAEQDVEHVHRLRVGTRRAVAALRLYRDRLPRKRANRMKKWLQKIRRAAGDARDLDVLGQRLFRDYGERAAPVMPRIADERAAVQPAVVAVAERCRRRDRFVRKTTKLLEAIRPPDGSQPSRFGDWATVRLAEAADQFFASQPTDANDLEAVHQFRIAAKALRYTIELVAPAFGSELRKRLYPVVEEIQEHLGQVQDHVAAEHLLSRLATTSASDDQRSVLLDLAAEEQSRVVEAHRKFRAWWSPDRTDSLRMGLKLA